MARGRTRFETARPRAFTLAELILSAGLTAAVAAAAMSLMWSVSRESVLMQSEQVGALRGQALMRRLTAGIRASRTVSIDSATQITIWCVDDYPLSGSGGAAGDDAPQASEVETISHDAANRRVLRSYFDFSGASAATMASLNISVGVPGLASVSFATVLAANPGLAPYAKTETWAEDVGSCSFRGINKGGRPVMVAINVTIGTGSAAQSFHQTIRLAGPAYYLGGSGKSADGLSGGRLRPTASWTW